MCMGRTHVLMTGALATATANPLSEFFLDRPMSAPEIIAFGAVTAGFGLLPDLDHPSATLARVLGPVTRGLAAMIGTLAGGHRKGTHTVWFAGLMVVLFGWLLPLWQFTAAVTVFVGLYLVAMILRLGPRPRTGPAELSYALVAALGTAVILFLLPDPWWIPWAVGFGVIGHIVGDSMTVEGTYPLAVPGWRGPRVALPVLGRTDSAREHALALALVPAWLLAAWVAVNGSLGWTLPSMPTLPWI